MRAFTLAALLAGALASASAAPVFEAPRAGLRPDELGIVVREGDPVSEAIAEAYRKARGIPAENVVRLPIPRQGDSIPAAEFAALKARLDQTLPPGVQATLLTWLQPSRVTGHCAMSITSAFAFGHDDRRCSVGDRAGFPLSAYFDSDTTRPWDDLRLRPSMMLGADTLAEARVLIERGLRAEGTRPAGDGYLVRTTDRVRSLRWPDFRKAAASPGVHFELVDNADGDADGDALRQRTGVMFYFTGLARTPALDTNRYRPGAVGDSLTSSGGVLGGTHQTTVLEWLRAGLTGSYGTVEEPFAHEEKFPRVSVLVDHYQRGATLIEAYWKSVQHPGQGLFVGDPLARPWPDAPRWQVAGDRASLTTRALRRGRHYPVWHRARPSDGWTAIGAWTGRGAGEATYRIAWPGRGEVRVSPRPCPLGPEFSVAVRGDAVPPASGRVRRLPLQLELRLDAPPVGCDDPAADRYEFTAGAPGTGVNGRSARTALATGSPTLVRIDVALGADVQRGAVVPLGWRNVRTQASGPLGLWRLGEAAAVPPALRIAEPGPGWKLASSRLPTVADVEEGAGIVRVRFRLAPAIGGGRPVEALGASPAFTAELDAQGLPPGIYRLTAQGENAGGAVVATASVLVQVPGP